MRFVGTGLQGAWIIETESHEDTRGSFARTFCAREFRERRLESRMVQSSISRNQLRHTLRGLHWQAGAAGEAKLIHCVRGEILDVLVDLRRGSPTFGRHEKVVLSEDNQRMVYVPRGFAHGFLTLRDDTWVSYQMTNHYAPQSARGLKWNDPHLIIAWPVDQPRVSDQDANWPDFEPAAITAEMP
ncbi:MAG: dTDP-4-dehydrorhamnose 3,5-epimerase [Planctomycetes bacterium]|nr:dTDP-4-dehydrorhamnose 3,5-epimerase [Planctomycetota bacterium]